MVLCVSYITKSFKMCFPQEYLLKAKNGKPNIARGKTDPEIDSVTWIKFSNKITPLALVANLPTRWRRLH